MNSLWLYCVPTGHAYAVCCEYALPSIVGIGTIPLPPPAVLQAQVEELLEQQYQLNSEKTKLQEQNKTLKENFSSLKAEYSAVVKDQLGVLQVSRS